MLTYFVQNTEGLGLGNKGKDSTLADETQMHLDLLNASIDTYRGCYHDDQHPKLFSESHDFVYSFVRSDIIEMVLVYP